MNTDALYENFSTRLQSVLGEREPGAYTGIVGFSAGGPISIWSFPSAGSPAFVTCELAASCDQRLGPFGRYELLVHCSDRDWAQRFLRTIAMQTYHFALGPGHTVDLSAVLDEAGSIVGAFFEPFLQFSLEGQRFSVVRCIGITFDELQLAVSKGVQTFVPVLQTAGRYPVTDRTRSSVLAKHRGRLTSA